MDTWLFADGGSPLAMLWSVLLVVIGLGIVFAGHELGHVLAARFFRVKLARYYFGFDTADNRENFAAKRVPNRMAIISAGAIMNLILAVIFAAFAFLSGVPYKPCEIGGTVPGSPAWQAGIEEGSRIIQLGENSRASEHLRFDWDLRNAVGMSAGQEDLPMRIRKPNSEEFDVQLRPMVTRLDDQEIPMLGIEPAITQELSQTQPTVRGYPAADAQPALEGGDRIVAINGEKIQDGYHLLRVFSQQVTETLQLTVERAAKDDPEVSATTLSVSVEPNRLRRLGLVMTTGPISGVQRDSPASRAGVQKGDQLVSVNGETIGDPFSFAERLRPHYGQEVDIVVERRQPEGGTEQQTLIATPEPPSGYENVFTVGSPMGVRSLGIVFPALPQVASVTPGSPAEAAGIQRGDEIVSVAFVSNDPERKATELINMGRPWELNEHTITWPFAFDRMQSIDDDIQIALDYRRSDTLATATMKPVKTNQAYADRGFVFSAKSETRVAESWKEAVALGVRTTGEDVSRVFRFIKKLITGGLSPTNLGGPIAVGAVASSEASKGVSRLLMFLTFLSANLALLNFLPIPGLDGGHLLFLAVEGIRRKPVSRNAQLTIIAISWVGIGFLLRSIVIPVGCLSQLLRLIQLFPKKKKT